ncbi:MAG: MjaI family restriction endonuclease [Candidatus Parvarchaeota archaeon]|nr:MjaI family restriction endonuclease [Candidatus Jingweiarchaeum tengchongense]MCW1298551.1 MjaI family restriction endonuclease [Candidatus Jingweiarchaeum tengchongense]MCW1300203.1 MjaI family restriction endonuclease [Candidatus Jingweiarchaeum tengchongense]MCW1304563.1 MjaI family restriction endonuclease [Candidatus Jingweiarchaeum tengchongense]MCW1310235.1 MjaI family restriction endonuclease [Candidatus Jingweiarchaeum tengchongense]
MAKEWILNIANGRWGLTKQNRVGPVAAWIRECSPKEISEWENFYLQKLRDFLKNKGINLQPTEYLESLGKTLYTKITEVLRSEMDEVTEEECIEYIKNLVINRTFEGYITEKETIYGQLQEILNVKIEPAPDEWDRLYNVDFFIKIKDKYIGLQIKPVTFEHAPEFATKWREAYKISHEKFTKKFGGKVFIVLSVKKDKKKVIFNMEVINEIKQEINKLSS